jgi:hypothetical protein
MSDTQISEVTTEAPVAADTSVQTAPEAPKETFDQTLERVANEAINGKRGPDGKFQSRVVAQGAPETPELPGKPEAVAPELAPPAIEAPQSLPDDVKKLWGTLPPNHQQWLAKREGEIHEKITSDGQRLKSLSAFEEALKPFEDRLKQVNAPPTEYIRRLATADQLLATNGVQGALQIMQMYGIDPRAVLQAAFQTGQQPAPNSTPSNQNLEAIVDQKVEARLREQRVASTQGEIEKFHSALPADEQADFVKLEAVMVGLAQANPKWSLEQLYKAARKVDPEVATKDEAKASEAKRKAEEEEAKKKAAQDARLGPLGRKPGSTPAQAIKGKTWMETMERVGAEVLARN